MDSPVLPREEVLPQPIADGADGREMDAGEVGEGPEPMTIDRVQEGEDSGGRRGRVVEQLFFKLRLMCGARVV